MSKAGKSLKIALFGGSFDPIHTGHVRLALEFAERLKLDKVLLMPTYVPPHKLRPDMAPAADRLEMCRLAALDAPVLDVSDLEIGRGGRQLYGGHPGNPPRPIFRRPVVSDNRGGYVFDHRHLVAV